MGVGSDVVRSKVHSDQNVIWFGGFKREIESDPGSGIWSLEAKNNTGDERSCMILRLYAARENPSLVRTE